ncbi:D-ribose pyranase [Anaerobacillus alkalilacustris]|uniref:D-ribose pyranase n=1 Tax=Anaerobacillus alkalilacustris TaxID=393763 RepID=A0A1S2LRI2_9BACI|nr:D-ribose pyranase [Anaerobacillus alkalilacustris]OIJ14277.1 D-ribose pyranase [Anaerobacillus alkalilacustris]
MKKHGILNRDIASVLAKLGHTDTIVIADCGLPIPESVKCIDLSLKQGVPSFLDVLYEVLADMEVEEATFAQEVKTYNLELYSNLEAINLPIKMVSHENFKELTKNAKAIIRTGENKPYANIILKAGVIF